MTRRTLILFALVGALLAGQGTAWAAWLASGGGRAAGRAMALGTAPAPGISVTGGNDVALTIAQTSFKGQLLGAVAGGGWRVTRHDANGVAQSQTAGSTCTGLLSGSAATLACAEPNVPEGSWRYAAVPSLQAWRGSESTRTSAVIDSGPPTLSTLQASDTNANGRIDQVVATFSENLAAYTAGTTPWTLSGVPSGGSLGSVSVSGTTATLTVTEGSGAQDTAVGSLTVALAAAATGIRDAAGNQSAFAATAPADAAKPLAVAVAAADGAGTTGRMQTGDVLSLTYSEAIDPASIVNGWNGGATSVTVRVDNGSGLFGDDSLTIRSGSSTLDLGSVNLNRYDYVSGGDVDFTGSTMVRSDATITVTLGTPDQPSRVVTAGGAENMTWSPSTGAADPAGNAALGTAVSESGTSDRDF